MTRLQAMLDKQINITDIMNIKTEVENPDFFNSQSELDKKLILLLANKDFLESLDNEVQEQSKSLRRALIDEEKKKKAEEDDGSGSDSGSRSESGDADEDGEDEDGGEDEEDDDYDDDSEGGGGGIRDKPIKLTRERDDFGDENDEEKKEQGHFDEKDEKGVIIFNENKQYATGSEDEDGEDDDDDDEDVEEVSDFSDEEVATKNEKEKVEKVQKVEENIEEKKVEDKEKEAVTEKDPEIARPVVQEEGKVVEDIPAETKDYNVTEIDDLNDNVNKLHSLSQAIFGEAVKEEIGVMANLKSLLREEEKEIVQDKEQTKKNRKGSSDDDADDGDDYISSVCHTEEVSEVFNAEFHERTSNNYGRDYYYDEDDGDSADGDDLDYDFLFEINDDNQENEETSEHKNFVSEYQKIEKMLLEAKFLPITQQIPLLPDNNMTQSSIEDWLDKVFFMFINNQKLSVLDAEGNYFGLDSYSLFYGFLILALLDPIREAATLPVLALHLIGFSTKFCENLPHKNFLKEKIVNFLHQYAIRSPSIFFKSFTLSSFNPHITTKLDESKLPETFSIFDVLFMYYVIRCGEKNVVEGLDILLQRLLHFLFQVRLKSKEDEIPTYIKDLRKGDKMPLKEDVVEQVFRLIEDSTKAIKNEKSKYLYKWLEYLAHIPQYRKRILVGCEGLIDKQIPGEKNALANFIQKAKETLNGESAPTAIQLQYFTNIFSQLTFQTPEILNILSFILNEPIGDDSDARSFIQGSETFRLGLKDVSLYYMETLELVSKLKEKLYLTEMHILRSKLKKMVEVPVHYFLYLSKLREFALGDHSLLDKSLDGPPDLMKIPSDKDTPLVLERSYSSARNESFNFQEVLPHWLKKHRTFINGIFKSKNSGEEHTNLWMVKNFPWILDFNVKEKILRYDLLWFIIAYIV